MGSTNKAYIGRFAPSPTGPLHLGSLIGALASFLDAKAHQGQWLLRIEDLDPPREIPGAADDIIRTLVAHGFEWDGDILWQSQRHGYYQNALDRLVAKGLAFYCSCSRRQLKNSSGIYPGTCRGRQQSSCPEDCAIRLQVADNIIIFSDAIQGDVGQQLQRDVGDFVLKRKDGLFAYQLAVVVDDAAQGITHVVRGSDLLDSTPRQIYLQTQLDLPHPEYAHFPVITNPQGQKLSKQSYAPAIDDQQACTNLLYCLGFLKQPLPPEEHQQTPKAILSWACQHWDLHNIPKQLQIAEQELNSHSAS